MSQPTITIVTPSLDQGEFIEQTICSVLDQGIRGLEYIVIDGGSRDGTLDVLRRYEAHLAHWVSEPDNGQADAINKGLALAGGEICGYLNSDDLYEPGSLARVIDDFRAGPASAWHAYPVQDFSASGVRDLHRVPHMSRRLGDPTLEERERLANDLLQWIVGRIALHQPGVFWRREHWFRAGGFDTRNHYAFDRAFFMSLVAARFPLVCHDGPAVARFRHHEASKTGIHLRGPDNAFSRERIRISNDFDERLPAGERAIARRLRVEDEVSTAWRMFRQGASRRRCQAWMARVALSKPEALRSRYFWGSALRFLARGRPGRREEAAAGPNSRMA